jgi:hypothetical protein
MCTKSRQCSQAGSPTASTEMQTTDRTSIHPNSHALAADFSVRRTLSSVILLRVVWYMFAHFSMFTVDSSNVNCPPIRCASAANVASMEVEIFKTKIVSFSQIS